MVRVSNWMCSAIILAILIGCAGGGTSTFVQRPGGIQPTPGNPGDGLETLPGVIPPLVDGVPVVDQGSEGHAGLPAFPGGGGTFSPVHKVSEAEYQTPGDGFVDSFGAHNRAGAVDGEYVLIPEEGDIAWAMYSIPDLTGDRPVRVEIAVSPAELKPGSGEDLLLSYWIGVADYTLYHWDWQGPFTAPQDLVINSEELRDRFVSAEGTLHWVAVLYGNEPGGLPGVTLQSGTVVVDPAYFANKPHYTAIHTIEIGIGGSGGGKGASALETSQYITVEWDHVPAFGPNDTQNEAYIYQVFRLDPGSAQPVNIGSLLAPDVSYVDPTDNPSTENEPLSGRVYRYYLRAVNQNGFTPLSTPQKVLVPMLPPGDVTASDRGQLGKITLSWTAAEGADDYLVYRDLQDAPIAATGDVLTWDDDTLNPGDGAEHTYWLRSANQYAPEGSGPFSDPALGRQDTLPVADLFGAPGTGWAPLVVGFDAGTSHDPDDGTNPGDGISLYGWDFNGDGIFSNEIGSLPEEDAAAGGHPVGSTAQYTFGDDGTFNPAVRVTDSEGNSSTQSVEISVGNSPPVADLSADPLTGIWPLTVDFDASGSSDVDGNIVSYEFDFDEGVGWENYGENPIPSHEFTEEGNYTATVRVTDDDGGTDIDTVAIEVITNRQGDWWMFGRDAKHNRRSPSNGPETNALDWTFATGDGVYSSPAIGADGTVYVASRDYKLYAINADGSFQWSYPTDGVVYSSPAIGTDGTVYVGSIDGKLYAINPDGTWKWSYPTGGWVPSSPAVGANGTVYVASRDYKLHAINADGSFGWSYTTEGQVDSSPVIAGDGTVYVGSADDNLYAINPDGTERWAFTTGGDVYSSPAIGADGTVYVGSYDYKLYAINPDGSLSWSYLTGGEVYSSPAIGADGTVFFGSSDNKLYAINPDGSLQWSYTTGEYVRSSPAIGADGTVYVGSNDNKLYAINQDGSLKWSYTTGDAVESSPAIGADGTVYVGSYDYKLYAFYTTPGNTPPTADLQASPTSGDAPLIVDFDASGSTDSEGPITQYDYDWETDGTYDLLDGGATPAHTYSSSGTYSATVRVMDDDGATETAVVVIQVCQWWTELAYATSQGGRSKGFAFNSAGYPAILHRFSSQPEAYYSYYDGDNWQSEDPDPTASLQSGGNLAFDSSGNPAIAFTFQGATIRFSHFNGASWDAENVVGNTGDFPSLAFLPGDTPIIAYYDQGSGNLRLAKKTSGWNFETIDSAPLTGTGLWLAIDSSGLPGVAYHYAGNDDIRYAHHNGTDWDIETVDADVTITSSAQISFAFDSTDRAGISYFDAGSGDLKYAHFDDPTWSVLTVGSAGYDSFVGFDLADMPAVAYQEVSSANLKFAKYNGSSWDTTTVDSSGDVRNYQMNLLFDPNGFPSISYYRDDGNYYAHYGPGIH